MTSPKTCCYSVGREKIFHKMDRLGGIFFTLDLSRGARKRTFENVSSCWSIG